jgi:hypothetical protein
MYHPDKHRETDNNCNQFNFIMLDITKYRFHYLSKVITGERDSDSPDTGTDKIQNGETQIGNITHAYSEGCHCTDAIEEAKAQYEQDLMPFKLIKHLISRCLPGWAFGQHASTVTPAEKKIKLVAEECPAKAADNNPVQRKVSYVCGDTSQYHHCFSFEEGAEYDGRITVSGQERFQHLINGLFANVHLQPWSKYKPEQLM